MVKMQQLLYIQRLWSAKIGWDTPVADNIRSQWFEFRRSLVKIKEIGVPRWLGTSINAVMEIHIFCDASSDAYAAAAYARVVNNDGSISTQLITARTKLAPVKTISIPRLELCAAEIGATLYGDLKQPMGLSDENVYFWSDSSVTLSWIKRLPNLSKTYVANRVTSILSLSNESQWSYICTELNPADCASRGMPAAKLVNYQLWWHGPEFLCLPKSEWPLMARDLTSEERTIIVEETRGDMIVSLARNSSTTLDVKGESILSRCSTLHRLLRVTAFILRVFQKTKPFDHYVCFAERSRALNLWIKHEHARVCSPM